MFEKEAEEWRNSLNYEIDNDTFNNIVIPCIEFGYNKAKEDADKMKSRFLELCNLKDMRIAELEKANEWHEIESKVNPKREISKQYMPKNKEKVLLKYHSGDDEVHISDGYYDAYDSEFHIANNPKFRIVCVIAWREFPKKENE